MAGLGLMDAVRGYQQGVDWRNQQNEIARNNKIQADYDAVNKGAGDALTKLEADDLTAQRQAWASSNTPASSAATGALPDMATAQIEAFAPKPFRPNDAQMFQIGQDRQSALIKAGLLDKAIAGEAHLQAQRLRVRQGAIDKYRITGNAGELGKTIYNLTIPDGVQVTGMSQQDAIEGAPASDANGSIPGMPARAATPGAVTYQLSDGTTTKPMSHDEIVANATRLADPQYAAHEAAYNLERLKSQLATTRELAVERVKGGNSANVANITGGYGNERQKLANAGSLAVADTQGQYSVRVGQGNNKATLGAARLGADASDYSADSRLEGTQYTADKHLESAKKTEGGLKANVLSDMIIKHYGTTNPATLSGANTGNQSTARMLREAQQYMRDKPTATEGEAIEKAAEVLGLPKPKLGAAAGAAK